MGQYYKPINLDKKQWLYSHSYGNGLKLMEHSWIENNFVQVVENLIKKGGAWHGDKIVWAGDYADGEPEHGEANLYNIIGIDANKIQPNFVSEKDVIFAPRLGCYLTIEGNKQVEKENIAEDNLRFLKNLDTNEFVDMKKVPVSDIYTDDDGKKWYYNIHPLPLLTCEGNGRGGGDFGGNEKDLVGIWARQRVIIQKSKPKNCTEIIFDLKE